MKMKPTIFSSQNTIRYNEKSKFEEKILIFEILRKNLKSIPKLGHVTLSKWISFIVKNSYLNALES